MTRVYAHKLDAYGTTVLFGQGEAGWRALRRRLPPLGADCPDGAGFTQFATYRDEVAGNFGTFVVIWVQPSMHRCAEDWVDTLAHEAQHAAAMVMDYIGHEPVGVDEPTAYLTGFLARWCFERCEREA